MDESKSNLAKHNFTCLGIILIFFSILIASTWFLNRALNFPIFFALVIVCIATIGILVGVTKLFSWRAFQNMEGEVWFVYTPRKSSRHYIESKILPLLDLRIRPVLLQHGRIPWQNLAVSKNIHDFIMSYIRDNLELERGDVRYPRLVFFHNGKKKEFSLNIPFYENVNKNLPPEHFIKEVENILESYLHTRETIN